MRKSVAVCFVALILPAYKGKTVLVSACQFFLYDVSVRLEAAHILKWEGRSVLLHMLEEAYEFYGIFILCISI